MLTIYAGPCALRPRAFAGPQSPLMSVSSWQCFPSLTDFNHILLNILPHSPLLHLAAPPWNTLAFSGLPSEDTDFLSSSSPSPSPSRLPRSTPPACGPLRLTDRSLSFRLFYKFFHECDKGPTKGNSERPSNSHTLQGRHLGVEGHAGNLNTHKAEAGHGRLQCSLWHTVRTVLGWQVWGPASLAPLRHYLVTHFGPSLLPAFPRDLQSQLETLDLYSKTAFPHPHLCSAQVIFSDLNNSHLILSLLDYSVLL